MSQPLNLTAPERAAVMLLALDEEVAKEVLRHLDPGDLRKLAQTAERLGALDADAQRTIDAALGKAPVLGRAHVIQTMTMMRPVEGVGLATARLG